MKKTAEQFIKDAIIEHGDYYDYSKVEYENSKKKVCIICPKHGEFWQRPNYHLSGSGCPKCAIEKNSEISRLTNQDFVKRSKAIHGDKYDYSKVEYVNYTTKVCIMCPEHGEFWQTPREHLDGNGCPKCSKNHHYSTEEIIQKFKDVHGDKYDYSKVNYKTQHEKVCIICPEHGEFWQTPHNHLRGQGCSKCAGVLKITNEEFIRKAKEVHGDKYDYSKVNYINNKTKVCIICPEHGEFYMSPNSHLSGQGCRKCGIEKNTKAKESIFSEDFFNKAYKVHGNKYDYSKVKYARSKDKICILCHKKDRLGNEHGEFWQTPNSHLMGQGCPKCGNTISKDENEIFKFIKNNLATIKGEKHNREILNGKEIDILIPSKNIAFEYDGLRWHSEKYDKDKNYHLNKTKECLRNGIQLYHIFEDEWVYKNEIVKSRIKNILGVTENKIFARKCIIKEITDGETKVFLNANHLQGYCNSKCRYGLYYNDELVSVMTFGHLRKNLGSKGNDNEYELLRFCNKLDTTVIGGASKLLKHFIDKVKPKKVISYADRRWSNGNLYRKLGFKHIRNSEPSYSYIYRNKRENRFKYRKDVLVKQGFDPNKSEHEIMLERGIYRIYDCGTMVFEMKF